MSRTLLVAGTASHVGKSTVAAGLCRLLADRGVSVAPFKAQNMSNNARVVVRAPESGYEGESAFESESKSGEASRSRTDEKWGEIGVSQFVQSRAAGITPTTDVNPVLLKPRGDGESQLIVDGRAVDHLSAGDYYEAYWKRARTAAGAAHRRLAAEYDVIVAEGAGSIAEINLHDRDLANVETARFADAEILLLVDIERGGAFATLYGTLELLPDDLRERVVGAAITKFRGDASLLEPGIGEIESRTGVPILGVLPYADPGLPEEDSVGLPPEGRRATVGGGREYGRDGAGSGDERLTIAVPRLPRLSNATDLEALAAEPGVVVEYVPLDESLEEADAVVVPGTKNAVDDLLALRRGPLGSDLVAFPGPVVGICGGYQLLGERLANASIEGTGDADVVEGLGLLPVETSFAERKRLERTTVPIDGDASPLLAGASGTASGYEIHAGRTRAIGDVTRPLGETSAARGLVLGTYLHGLFDEATVREAFLAAVAERAGIERPRDGPSSSDEPHSSPDDRGASSSAYDRAASLVADHVDLAALGEPFA